ncbi:hypothetical protein BDQ17DRAFT_1365925, partial [Cyathus striatus]
RVRCKPRTGRRKSQEPDTPDMLPPNTPGTSMGCRRVYEDNSSVLRRVDITPPV